MRDGWGLFNPPFVLSAEANRDQREDNFILSASAALKYHLIYVLHFAHCLVFLYVKYNIVTECNTVTKKEYN